jgi:alanine-glyoxylate transaminase/serine-glyoxylate transaminase/serine-pyruvate transaminase
MTATHVDTSTGVRVDAERFGALGREHGVFTVLDGVCSVAGEDLRQEAWGIDVVLTASQKAIGVPPGLALLVVSQNLLCAWGKRKTKVANYYADWSKWLPIMASYEKRVPSYFATPAVNLVCALGVSLEQILDEGIEERIARHRRLARACRAAIRSLGLDQVPTDEASAANTMTAPRYPEGVSSKTFLSNVRSAGVILAGGLHPKISERYFRIGHMGATRAGDVLATIGAVEVGLQRSGYRFEAGVAVAAAQAALAGERDTSRSEAAPC